MVVEEELRADVICSLINFSLEMIKFEHAVGCIGMSFWEAGHTDAESFFLGVGSGFIEFTDEGDEFGSMLKFTQTPVVIWLVTWWVSSQCKDIGDTGGSIAFENALHF